MYENPAEIGKGPVMTRYFEVKSMVHLATAGSETRLRGKLCRMSENKALDIPKPNYWKTIKWTLKDENLVKLGIVVSSPFSLMVALTLLLRWSINVKLIASKGNKHVFVRYTSGIICRK